MRPKVPLLLFLSRQKALGKRAVIRSFKAHCEKEGVSFENALLSWGKGDPLFNRFSITPPAECEILQLERTIRGWLKQGMNLIYFDDDQYPSLLKQLSQPPLILFCEGSLRFLNTSVCVSIVGARSANLYGISVAEKFADELAQRNITIVSGLAHGIDAAAHRGALRTEAPFPTIAVLGQGLCTRTYPPVHWKLRKKILDHGGMIISMFEPDLSPRPELFIERNEIIAGLSHVTCVVQAKKRSGALVTAQFAIEAGREVCAVPGMVDDPLSFGPHQLIRDGATLINESQDIIQLLPDEVAETTKPKLRLEKEFRIETILSNDAKKIFEFLKMHKKEFSFDQLSQEFLSVENLHEKLLELELEGLIARKMGNLFEIRPFCQG